MGWLSSAVSSVKDIVKSPIGTAALGAGLGALVAPALGIGALAGGVGGGLLGLQQGASEQQAEAAETAAEIQSGAAEKAIAQQNLQFNRLMDLLSPYRELGIPAAERLKQYEFQITQPALQTLTGTVLPQTQQQAGTLAQIAGAAPGALSAAQRAGRAGEISQFELSQLAKAAPGALRELQTFSEVGQNALMMQQALSGAAGPQIQKQVIANIEQSPEFQTMARQGEAAILQNASATGGLRGGNVQAALAQYRPQLLNQFIQQKYQQLGGLAQAGLETSRGLTSLGAGIGESAAARGAQATQNLLGLGAGTAEGLYGRGAQTAQNLAGMGTGFGQQLLQTGQASAAGTGAAGMQSAAQIGSLLGQIGQAQAGGALAAGAQGQQLFSNLLGLVALGIGAKQAGLFG